MGPTINAKDLRNSFRNVACAAMAMNINGIQSSIRGDISNYQPITAPMMVPPIMMTPAITRPIIIHFLARRQGYCIRSRQTMELWEVKGRTFASFAVL